MGTDPNGTWSLFVAADYYEAGSGMISNGWQLRIITTATPGGGVVSINAADRGWYDATGFHDPVNGNYLAGNHEDLQASPYRNWFAFTIPPWSVSPTAAELKLFTYGASTADPSEFFQLKAVSTPVAALVAGGSGLTNIYRDLGDGSVFGSRAFFVSDANRFVSIPFNASAAAHLSI